jgi:hypothetical protein
MCDDALVAAAKQGQAEAFATHLVIRVPGLRPPLKMNFDRLDQRG